MAITLLYGCAQIETTARNLAETRSYFHEVLGAGPIEQELAAQIDTIIPDPDYGCDHIGLGESLDLLGDRLPAGADASAWPRLA